jgi:Zn-finger nucleic acid-binding protein
VANVPAAAVDAEILRCGSCGAAVDPNAAICEYCTSPIVRDGRTLELICPECYARNEERSRFCTACGVAFRPEPVPAGPEVLPCVRCGCLMPRRDVGGTAVHECPRCHGLWAAGHGFDDLVRRAIDARRSGATAVPGAGPRVRRGNPVREPVRYRKCPECGSLMRRENFRRTSGVVVDRCRQHGTWLDADELEQVAGFILSGGLERAPETIAHLLGDLLP